MPATPLFERSRARIDRLRRRTTGAPSPLADRTVLITGASSGIGEATAYAVARRGATVLIVARREDELERVAQRISDEGGQVATYVADLSDVTDGGSIDRLIAEVTADHGTVDHLVNNAGRSIRRSLERQYDRFHDFERTMAINYFGPVRLTMGLIPAMRVQRFGHVVNIVTWGVQLKAPKFAAYIASKTALDTWGRILGREFFADNIAVTNIRVSLVRTPMVAPTDAYEGRGVSPEQAAERIVRALEDRPITRNTVVGSLGEVANLVAPRTTDAFFSWSHRRFPDSSAASLPSSSPSSSQPSSS